MNQCEIWIVKSWIKSRSATKRFYSPQRSSNETNGMNLEMNTRKPKSTITDQDRQTCIKIQRFLYNLT